MAIDELLFAKLRDAFTDEWKKIEPYISRRPLTKKQDKILEYKQNLTFTFCRYLLKIYHNSDIQTKIECVARINPYREKTKRAFEIIRFQYNWPVEELTLIDINQVKPIVEQLLPSEEGQESDDSGTAPVQSTSETRGGDIASSSGLADLFVDAEDIQNSRIDEIIHNLSSSHLSSEEVKIVQQEQTEEETVNNQSEFQNSDGDDSSDNSSENDINLNENSGVTMPQTAQEFFKLAASVLNYKYDGDPLLRDSFIEDCELIESMAGAENEAHCLKFIKSKMVGRARETLPEVVAAVKDITDELKKKIKSDSSTVVEGGLTALRVIKGNFTKFSEEAEKLVDAFRRSLRNEQFTKEKADEITIKKTQELCRRVAHSESVKSIIASKKFETPAEVIATLITEGDVARREKKEQEAYQKRSNHKNNNKKYNKNQKYNKNDNKGQNKGKFQKNRGNDNHGGKSRSNRNDHVIRIVSDANAPSASSTNANNDDEQVFRLNQS